MRLYRTCGSGGSCGIIFIFCSARCFLQKYGRSDPLAQNRWKSLYYRSKSMEIDKKRCTVVMFPQKSMEIVVLSFKIDANRQKTLYCRVFCSTIDEHRCTVVQNRWNSMHFISKTTSWLRTSPKKSKKRQAKTQLLQIRSTPIALPAPRPDLLIKL